jgi:hypothetical protein
MALMPNGQPRPLGIGRIEREGALTIAVLVEGKPRRHQCSAHRAPCPGRSGWTNYHDCELAIAMVINLATPAGNEIFITVVSFDLQLKLISKCTYVH